MEKKKWIQSISSPSWREGEGNIWIPSKTFKTSPQHLRHIKNKILAAIYWLYDQSRKIYTCWTSFPNTLIHWFCTLQFSSSSYHANYTFSNSLPNRTTCRHQTPNLHFPAVWLSFSKALTFQQALAHVRCPQPSFLRNIITSTRWAQVRLNTDSRSKIP